MAAPGGCAKFRSVEDRARVACARWPQDYHRLRTNVHAAGACRIVRCQWMLDSSCRPLRPVQRPADCRGVARHRAALERTGSGPCTLHRKRYFSRIRSRYGRWQGRTSRAVRCTGGITHESVSSAVRVQRTHQPGQVLACGRALACVLGDCLAGLLVGGLRHPRHKSGRWSAAERRRLAREICPDGRGLCSLVHHLPDIGERELDFRHSPSASNGCTIATRADG